MIPPVSVVYSKAEVFEASVWVPGEDSAQSQLHVITLKTTTFPGQDEVSELRLTPVVEELSYSQAGAIIDQIYPEAMSQKTGALGHLSKVARETLLSQGSTTDEGAAAARCVCADRLVKLCERKLSVILKKNAVTFLSGPHAGDEPSILEYATGTAQECKEYLDSVPQSRDLNQRVVRVHRLASAIVAKEKAGNHDVSEELQKLRAEFNIP